MKNLIKTLAAFLVLTCLAQQCFAGGADEVQNYSLQTGTMTFKAIESQIKAATDDGVQEAFQNGLTTLKTSLGNLGITQGTNTVGSDDIYGSIYKGVLGLALNPGSTAEMTGKVRDEIQSTSSARFELQLIAKKLFWILAVVQLGFTLGVEFIGSGLDLQVFIAALIRYFITIGFFFYILNTGPSFLGSFVSYFMDVGVTLTGSASFTEPTACFNLGLQFFNICLNAVSAAAAGVKWNDWKPLYAAVQLGLGLLPCAFLVAACMIVISTWYLITLFEGFFIVTVGMLLLGLGGCRFTWGIVEHIIRMVAQVGLKCMTFMVLMSGINRITLAYLYDITSIATPTQIMTPAINIFGVTLVFTLLCKELPQYVASLIPSGNAGGAGTGLFSMASAAYHTAKAAVHTGSAIAHTPGKGVNAVVKGINAGATMKGDFMHGIHEPSAMGFGALNPQTGKRGPFTMTGAVGALLGGGRLAGAVGAGAIGAVKAAVRPEGKEADNASSAAVGGSKGITGEADKMSSHESQGNTAGTPKGSLENSDAGGNVGSGNGTGSSVDSSAGSPANSAASSGANTAAPSGNSAASGTGSSVDSSAGSPANSAASSGANTAAPSGNSTASGTEKSADGKPNASAKGGKGAALNASGHWKGKAAMFEAAGFKKGSKPKSDGKK